MIIPDASLHQPDASAPQERPGLRGNWLALGAYCLLAIALSWPLVAHLSSRFPGTATWAFDESTFVWNIWYFKHALLDLHTSPLHSELIWFPLGIDLILFTYNFFNAIIALPLQVAINLPLASNLALLLSTALSGFGAYLLALDVLRNTDPSGRNPRGGEWRLHADQLAAFLAGLIYAYASNRAIYAALGHYDMVTTQWLPFYTLYLLKTLRQPRLKNAILVGMFFAAAALAEMIFASFLALFSLVLLLAQRRGLRQRWAALGRLALAALVAVLIWSPVLAPIVREFLKSDYALTGWGESIKLSADLAGLLTPTDLNPLLSQNSSDGQHWAMALRAVEEGKGRFGDINTLFLGYVTLALALVGVWRGKKLVRAWCWSALAFGLLALGPLLQIGGKYRFSLDNLLPEGVTFPLPFALLHYLPFINANRAPNRNSVILMLVLAVLASFGARWLLDIAGKWPARNRNGQSAHSAAAPPPARMGGVPARRYFVTAILAGLIIIEHLAVPLPTTAARVPEIYHRIAQEPGDFAIMQLPLGWRNSFGVLGSERTQLQYYQTVHGKPMIGGNISRAPAFKMDYFARIPLFRALTDLELYREVSPEMDTVARAQAGELMALYDIRYLIMAPPIPGRYPYQDTWQRTQAYALDVLPLEKPAFWEADGFRAYRVIQPELPFPFRLDLGTAGIGPYLGQGWDPNPAEQPFAATADWATGARTDLYLPLGEENVGRPLALRLAIAPLTYEGGPGQTVSVSVNGMPVLTNQPLAPGWQTVTASVPGAATRRGPNRIELAFAWAVAPRQVFPDPASRAMIGNTGIVSPVNLDIHAFSEAFISAFAADGSETKASVGRRGYNVAVLDEKTGRVLDTRGFDSAANAFEADALADYLTALPPGRIVLLATKGDATAHLNPAAVAALRGIGSRISSTADLAGFAHVLAGVQGAEPGTAAEVFAADDAFLRVAGDFRTLAAAVDWAELGP